MSMLAQVLQIARLLPRAVAFTLPGLGPWLARRRWPRTRGAQTLRGLESPVEVIRDRWGVPHIFAATLHDLVFAQGYVHAQDRLFQMDLGRRAGEGSLAAALGPALVPTDRVMRTLGLRRAAERQWQELDPEGRALLEAYAAGINARIHADPLPLELALLDLAPAPWSPVDTLTRGNLLGLALGGNHRLELLRAQILAEAGDAGEAIAQSILPPHAPDTPLIVPPEAHLAFRDGLRGKSPKGLDGLDALDRVMGDPNIVSGSNNWVVHGSRTASRPPDIAPS